MADKTVVKPAAIGLVASAVSVTAGVLGEWHWWGAGIGLIAGLFCFALLIIGLSG